MRLDGGWLAAHLRRSEAGGQGQALLRAATTCSLHVCGLAGQAACVGREEATGGKARPCWLPVCGRASWAPCVSLAQQAGLADDARLSGGSRVGMLC